MYIKNPNSEITTNLNQIEFQEKLQKFLLDSFQLKVKNINYFINAFTHKSFFQKITRTNQLYDYDALEYLGDSLINWIISKKIFQERLSSGHMSKLRQQIIQAASLKYAAQKIQIDTFIRIGKSITIMPDSIIEDVFESFVAAIYLDLGLEEVEKFISNTLWQYYLNNELDFAIDYKTILQEEIYKLYKTTVQYSHTLSEDPKNKTSIYFVKCKVNELYESCSQDSKLKMAEQKSAKILLNGFIGITT